tara:strand:- start:4385 stop:5059 length:675 start_codon:yes stop_codon:yes gene_type:complete
MSLTSEQNNIPTMLSKHYKKRPNIKLKKIQNKKSENVVNRGTGAGGAQTNINGNKLEKRVRNLISEKFTRVGKPIFMGKVSEITGEQTIIEEGEINNQKYIRAYERAFIEWEKTHGKIPQEPKLMGSKQPDDCLINEESKTINLLECKSQQTTGSVAEKLQTATKKIRNLKRRFPGWNINYFYILDPYFKKKAKAEIADLDEDGIPYIWSDDEEFEQKLLNLLE